MDPSTKENIQALESVQRMATNYVTCNPRRPSPLHIEYKDRLLQCNLMRLTYRTEVYDLIFFIKSIRGLINFNIQDHVSFYQDRVFRITRNRENGLKFNYINPKLESTAHFYPVRIARLWNSLSIELRTKLTSPITLFQIKSILNKHYRDKFETQFETDNTCTWVTACRCTNCRPG